MMLYNASTSSGIINHARYLTRTNATSYNDADMKASINTYYHFFVNEIIEAMDGWEYGLDTNSQNLVANQQAYSFPTDILKIKRVEITYDGTNWYVAQPFDINMRGRATDTTSIGNDFVESKPYYDAYGTSLYLYPIPDTAVTNGLKIWYEKEITELSANTDEPTFAEAYHKGLAYGAAKDYFQKRKKKQEAKEMDSEMNVYLGRMKVFYNRRIVDDVYSAKQDEVVDYEY